MSGLVGEVAAFAVAVREKGLDPALQQDAARRVLDVIGNCLAARGEEVARIVTATVDQWGGHEIAGAIGGASRYPAPSAALVNGTLAHALDFDDTHLPSVLHPSSSVVPAALAVAEQTGADGAALLAAVAVGDEICVRLGMAGYDPELGNSIFFERGQHATAICGAVAAAASAGMLAGLDADGIASAMGVAASMGAGLLEANRTGGTIKRAHCGWAAHAAVAATDLARHGLTGPPTVLEGRFGFFQAWCGDQARPEVVVRDLGTSWELPGIFFKPYPCNHFTHAGIDAALQLREDGVDPADIAEIELGVPTPVLRTIAQPPEVKAAPPTGYAGAFSGPYTVAAALMGGGGLGVWMDDFTDEAVADPRRLELAAKVRCVADARCDEIFPHQFPAVLRVRTVSGTVLEKRVDANRGGPLRPLTNEELGLKFALGAGRVLPAERVGRLQEAVLSLASAPSVRDVVDLTRS
ncbi:MmgE/PrpD family protein [Nonomuraea jiangxiensis]|uniref:2-methylcitrate dehydratase PrpD n=1 Tax=Nonomuraea jiangxiensis TaxID=633440 RepID=A0A1G8TRV7_9ACTN|nr:MmgE/PrpD family protein [Nonomuraea jiangxiensis]SDJ44239.1 2-methylcitrate dehydratase PrpD [Nonomuraea jiangxiensis]